jgi:hypothetical protein
VLVDREVHVVQRFDLTTIPGKSVSDMLARDVWRSGRPRRRRVD